jgi:hypothetical protein
MAVTTLALRPTKKRRVILRKGRKFRRTIPQFSLGRIGQMYTQHKIIKRAGQRMSNMIRRSPAQNIRIQKANNIRTKKIKGFEITRTLMCNMGQCKVATPYEGGVVDPWATETLKFVGSGIPLISRLTIASNYKIDQANPAATAGITGGQILTGFTSVVFIPQWPGAKANHDAASQILGATSPQYYSTFGVKAGNQLMTGNTGENFQFNNVAVQGLQRLYDVSTGSGLTNSTGSNYGNVLNVMNSYITIELFNPSQHTAVDVHIFTFYQKSLNYQNWSGSCTSTINLNTWVADFAYNATNNKKNTLSEHLIDQIRKGKLPSKVFQVLKHRKVTLGARPTCSASSPVYKQNGPATNTKKVKMRFAGKKFYRQFCSNQSEEFDANATIQEKFNSVQKVMMIALPSQTIMHRPVIDDSGSTNPIATIANVWYKIHKTNLWTISGNN